MKNASTITAFIISFLVVGSLALVFLFMGRQGEEPAPASPAAAAAEAPARQTVEPQPTVDPLSREDINRHTATPPAVVNLSSPQTLAQAIATVIQDRDLNTLKALEVQQAVTAAQSQTIRELMEARHIRLSSPGITSIGANNQSANPTARYTLNFSSGARGYLDMKRNDKQQWALDALTLPSKQDLAKDKAAPMVMNDPMGIVSSFMDAVAKADFRGARKLVDSSRVQDATVAGLCILFEEGTFRLREDAPIKTAYEADTNAGFFVHLQDAQGRKAGNVGLTVAKTDGKWLIAEASLDSMLEAYTKRQGAGDDFFIPIVKNPKGGDSLALFFGFNEDTLSQRSARQLQIVAEAIKMDGGKKLEISGHTDDVGSERYNQGLSERRAAAVKAQLIAFGVPAEQIVTKGFGKSQPRRIYSTAADERARDEARKENRRAEMYLDF